MSLSERLKQAEQNRSSPRPPGDPGPAASDLPAADRLDPVIDLTTEGGPVLDLTTPTSAPTALPGIGIGIGGGTGDRTTATPCPRCSGPTHLDMFDDVHQTASLSCLACFHMFRVPV